VRFVLTLFMLALAACASQLKVYRLQDFSPESSKIILLGSSRFDSLLRMSMSKEGFKVLKYASTEKIISKGSENDITRIYDEAKARYGLTLEYQVADVCMWNSGKRLEAVIEVTDLVTNEVLLYIGKGGWTQDCGIGIEGTLFDDLAQALRKEWVQHK